jgi:hypothetical protein
MNASKAELKKYYEGVFARQSTSMNRKARRAESREISRNPQRNPARPENLKDFIASYREAVTSRIGLLCLSEVPDDILMWAHYANSHRGICLVFDHQVDFFAIAQPIVYQKARPNINPIHQSHEQMMERALLTKSEHWCYEREWRITRYEHGAGIYTFPPQALVGIILGAEISRENRVMVKNWALSRTEAVSLYQSRLSEKGFSVNIDPLTQ